MSQKTQKQEELQLILELLSPLLSSPSAGSLKPMQPVLAPRSSTSNSQHLSRPQGIVKTSSRLPVPSAISNPANRMPLVSRGVPSVRGVPAPESLPARRGLPRSSALGHRGEVNRQVAIRVGAGQMLLVPPPPPPLAASIFPQLL